MRKIILAFSGGLDTSFCVLHLREKGFAVITVTVDTGGFSRAEAKRIAARAKELGAIRHYNLDATGELYDSIASYIIKGNVLRGGVYPLSAGSERIVIAKKMIDIARKEKASYVAHGSTGAGNDHIRFDVTLRTLAPDLAVIAPIRSLALPREDEIRFLERHGVSVPVSTKEYSINQGLLGITLGGKETKGSVHAPPESAYPGISALADAPDKPARISIGFKRGLPVSLGGKPLSGLKILQKLHIIGAKHGIGKGIHLGDTIVGIKGRIGFAAPGILIAIKAHRELEKLVLTKEQAFWKDIIASAYGGYLHEARYFDPAARDMEAFIDSTQERVEGIVSASLYKGNCMVEGCDSPYSLMRTDIAVYGEGQALWTGADAESFAKLYALQGMLSTKVGNKKRRKQP